MEKLALYGGAPVLNEPMEHRWPVFDDSERRALRRVEASGRCGRGGREVAELEERFARYSGARHCVACANGTVAIELLLRALDIGRGDEVILPPYTFIASVSAIVFAGATPVFADIDPDTYLLSAASVEQRITPRTKAILAVCLGGRPADFDALSQVAKKHGLFLLGDAAQAAGSRWKGEGLGAFGDAMSYSCQNSKNLTSGEGGILTTNDAALAKRLRVLLNGGLDERGEYSMVGSCHAMSEFQAAILLAQLDRLDAQIARREASAARLDEILWRLGFVSPLEKDPRVTKNSYHLYLIRLDEAKTGVPRRRFVQAVCAEGLPLTEGYAPLYSFPCLGGDAVRRMTGAEIDCAPDTPAAARIAAGEATWLGQRVLLLPEQKMDAAGEILSKVYDNRARLLEGE